jgi:predicted amidohydrolase
VKIGHCQLESRSGDFDMNLAKMVKGLEWARREHVEIVSFPECFLTGYQDTEAETRKHAFTADGERMQTVIGRTAAFDATVIVGFNELRGDDLYNTCLVAQRGHLLGTYSKCTAYMPFHKQGRDFPVFRRGELTFGVIICADGGYIEPARILAAKGAKVIFAPHYNYIRSPGVLGHFMRVRADHTARAVENAVYFVRGNNVVLGPQDTGIAGHSGVGYGDSYVIDPSGEIVARTARHREDYLAVEIDPALAGDRAWGVGRSLFSAREFGRMLLDLVPPKPPKG